MIEIDNIKLRKLVERDKYSLSKYADNYNIWLNLTDSFPHPYTIEDAESFIKYSNISENEFNLCIEFSGECIGMIGIIFNNGIRQKTAEFGYWLGEPFWGQGIMTKSAKAFIKYVFKKFEVERIQSSVFEWNKASMKVLEKLGFTKECISRNAIYKNHKLSNEHKFALLK